MLKVTKLWEPGCEVHVSCRVVSWIDDEPWPGWVEVSVVDADGQDWRFLDKVSVFDAAGVLSRKSAYPVDLTVNCTVVREVVDEAGRDIVIVRLTGWGYVEDEYRITRDQLVPAPAPDTVAAIERRRRGLPTVEDIQRELVFDLRHEDYQWLWELVWRLNTRHPDIGLTAKIRAAQAAVRGLLAASAIELWKADGWPPTTFEAMEPSEIHALFNQDDAWHDPNMTELLVEVREATRQRDP